MNTLNKTIITLSLLGSGCGATLQSQFAVALNNSDEQIRYIEAAPAELPARSEKYFNLLDIAIVGNDGREVALLWSAATVNKPDVVRYLLEKRFIQHPEKFNRLTHMLDHHPDLWIQ